MSSQAESDGRPVNAERSETTSIIVSLPSWLKVAAAIIALWGGLITWQIQRGLGKLDTLADRVGSIDTRVAVLEERLPQPLSKELAPLTDEVRKLGLEFAELRGQLGGSASAPAQSAPSADDVSD